MTPVQQFGLLKHEYPESTGSICAGLMTWQGDFTPSALSDTYRLKIVYRVGELPKAYIVSPKPLPLAEGATKLPHTYNYSDGKQRLCLFLPLPLFIGRYNGCTITSSGLPLENGLVVVMVIGMLRRMKSKSMNRGANPPCKKQVLSDWLQKPELFNQIFERMGIKPGPKRIAKSTGKPDRRQRDNKQTPGNTPSLKPHIHKKGD